MKFKLPSLQSLWLNFLKVIFRFPLQVVVAIAATVFWCMLVDAHQRSEEQLTVLLAVSNLALALLLAVDLYAEVHQFKPLKKWGLRFVAVLVCTGLYFILKPSFYLADVYRIGLLAFAFHLLVAFAPFINKGSVQGFWQFNKTLFLRFLTSALYAAVLFVGLAVALLAIDGLFNVNVEWQTYMRLLAVVTAGFMTIFFLSGLPDHFSELDEDESYPKGLKIFTQYVLIPLMTIYLLILLVYEAKIIVNWELPKGLVSTLILGYAVFGILSLLLIHPIKEKEGNGWMKLFSRFFYLMMIPLVVLLLLAVWKRVGRYGITESRYILIILAGWLTLTTVYFLFSKRKNIKVIPVSLCILALLATYGPQSAFSISEFSQVGRLNRLMKSGDKKDDKQREDVIEYLVDRHGLMALQPFTKVNLADVEHGIELKDTTLSRYNIKRNKTDTAFALLKIKRNASHYNYVDSRRFVPETKTLIAVEGYDYLIPIESYSDKTTLKINNVDLSIEKMRQYGNIKLTAGERSVEFDLRKMAKSSVEKFKTGKLKGEKSNSGISYLPPDELSITRQLDQLEIKLVLSSLNTTVNIDDEEQLNSWLNYNGYLLVRIK